MFNNYSISSNSRTNISLISGNGHVIKSIPKSIIRVCDWGSEQYRIIIDNYIILQICNLVDKTLCIEYIAKENYQEYLESLKYDIPKESEEIDCE